MSISLYPAASSPSLSVPNWQLVTSSAPTGVTTVTFSSLAGYSKYRVMMPIGVAGTSPSASMQLNGDSGANYQYSGITVGGGSTTATQSNTAGGTTQFPLFANGGGTNSFSFVADIDHALILTPKVVTINGGQQAYILSNLIGVYKTASLLTSITILAANNFTSGTIYLLGAN